MYSVCLSCAVDKTGADYWFDLLLGDSNQKHQTQHWQNWWIRCFSVQGFIRAVFLLDWSFDRISNITFLFMLWAFIMKYADFLNHLQVIEITVKVKIMRIFSSLNINLSLKWKLVMNPFIKSVVRHYVPIPCVYLVVTLSALKVIYLISGPSVSHPVAFHHSAHPRHGANIVTKTSPPRNHDYNYFSISRYD